MILEKDLIFSLDIGTRNIIGIVGEYTEDGKFNILAYSKRKHGRRNMYDGQIHNIEEVVKIVEEIKSELESKIGTSLKRVSIAAAGRSLKTCKIRIDKDIDSSLEIDRKTIEILELEAVQKAQEKINGENGNKLKYYSIGYSVMEYYLEDNIMNSLEGHKGNKIGVNLLATFLPQIVIEGLYSVISKSGLEVGHITLEPIAAINVAIKEELRLLNLALVDIGAGTSDIAITIDGNIMAYGMTSIAGDEITEALCKKYLLDFNQGEALKINLSKEEYQEFTNVVGMEYKLSTKEIVEDINEVLVKISLEIVEKILEYNGKPPAAIFLIGGSSQMPGLKEILADNIGLPKERVSIRDTSFIENVQGIDEELKGPDIITPIGIAIEGASEQYKNFLEIEFNGEDIRLFNTEMAKVSDLLVLTGYNPRKLMPKSGENFVYYLNGEKKSIMGSSGEVAKIYINEQIGDLNTPLKDGDVVNITEGIIGKKAEPKLFDCINREKNIKFNEEEINLIINVKVNGKKVYGNPKIMEEDSIEVEEIRSLLELLNYLNLDIGFEDILINRRKIENDVELNQGDEVSIKAKKNINLIINGDMKSIEYHKDKFVFVDIFDYIDFDLTSLKGKLVLKINGEDAEYLAELRDGDEIKIYWE
ncbi:MAG: cell division protein FtsA [Tissierellia bacterium]|nr:cell division protein FtsA [Tissierellia bacterium]